MYRDARDDLLQDLNGLCLWDALAFVDFLGEGPPVAVLDHHDLEPLVFVAGVTLHDVV